MYLVLIHGTNLAFFSFLVYYGIVQYYMSYFFCELVLPSCFQLRSHNFLHIANSFTVLVQTSLRSLFFL